MIQRFFAQSRLNLDAPCYRAILDELSARLDSFDAVVFQKTITSLRNLYNINQLNDVAFQGSLIGMLLSLYREHSAEKETLLLTTLWQV